jgi:oxalate decarboxylase/phosphoglucose isomerase-like protein (cupin superfamily)
MALVLALVAVAVVALDAANSQSCSAGSGQLCGTPEYDASTIKYPWIMMVNTSYSCIWGAVIPGIQAYPSVLTLPPCTYVTAHYHSSTAELNAVLKGKLNGTIFPNAHGVEPIDAQIGLGGLQVIPASLFHVLSNDQCEDVAMTHYFPTTLDTNLYHMWGTVVDMPESYKNAVLENGAEIFKSFESLNIPGISLGFNQPIAECKKRCGIDETYYQRFSCPEKMPLKERGFESLSNAKRAEATATTKSSSLDHPWKRYKDEDINFAGELLKSTNYECVYGNDIAGLNMRWAITLIAPCTTIAPHWHPVTDEVNSVFQGNLSYVLSQQVPRKAVHDHAGPGDSVVFPKGLPHSIWNDQCSEVALSQVFPNAMDEDFVSIFGKLGKASSQYKSDTFPAGKTDSLEKLNLIDGQYTVMPECMKRCNLPADFHKRWACPAKVPFQAGGIFEQIEVPLLRKAELRDTIAI